MDTEMIRKSIYTGLVILLSLGLPQGIIAQADGSERQTEAQLQARRNETKALIQALKAEIAKVKEDNTLSETQKVEKVKEMNANLREQVGKKGKRKGRGYGKRIGKYRSAEESAQGKERKEKIEAELKAIESDETLSEKEKMAQKEALLSSRRAEMKAKKFHGKKKRKSDKLENYYRGGEDQTHKSKLTTKQKERALAQLDNTSKALKAKLEKGKIDKAEYYRRMSEIEKVRSRVIGQ